MHKRICCAVMALALCVCVLAPHAYATEPLSGFRDLNPRAWYAQGVRYCIENDLMQGRGKNWRYFDPNDPVTRAQLVTILWRLSGEPESGLAMQYNDVPEDKWYAGAARWALAEDVMPGYSAAVFAPDEAVTREQLALILWRYARYLNGYVPTFEELSLDGYPDCGEVDPEAVEALRWADGMGIMTGVRVKGGGEMLQPNAAASRSATATILMRFCLDMGLGDELGVDAETSETE